MIMKNNISKISLPGALTIYTVEEIRIRFVDALRTPNDLELDLSEVTECDTAGVQLLCGARAAAAAAGLLFCTQSAPECVLLACAAVGIDPLTLESARQ
jgi:anti-anti-sigma regulatory factor